MCLWYLAAQGRVLEDTLDRLYHPVDITSLLQEAKLHVKSQLPDHIEGFVAVSIFTLRALPEVCGSLP